MKEQTHLKGQFLGETCSSVNNGGQTSMLESVILAFYSAKHKGQRNVGKVATLESKKPFCGYFGAGQGVREKRTAQPGAEKKQALLYYVANSTTKKVVMIKPHHLLYWSSGLALGLMVCAIFSCPKWHVAMPFMLGLSGFLGVIGYRKKQEGAQF